MATPPRKWSSLSTRQQNRYLGAGKSGKLTGTKGLTRAQVRDYYNRGGNLERAQGHIKYPGPDREELRRLDTGKATTKDINDLKRWQRNQAPAWLRNDVFTEDTAAKLAGLRLNPQYWKAVEFYYHRDSSATLYVYSTRGGYTRKIELSSDEAHEVRQYLAYEPNQRGRAEVLVFGTDVNAPDDDDTKPVPTARKGTPVPRRTRKKYPKKSTAKSTAKKASPRKKAAKKPPTTALLDGIADLVSEGIDKAVDAFNEATQQTKRGK